MNDYKLSKNPYIAILCIIVNQNTVDCAIQCYAYIEDFALRNMLFVSTNNIKFNQDICFGVWNILGKQNPYYSCLCPSSFKWVRVLGFSKVVATFDYLGGSFNLLMATTRDVWIILSFRIWGYVLHVQHVSYFVTNCGKHQWVIISPLSIDF